MVRAKPLRDNFGRVIDYMRISVTDRCNLRCTYCMPDGVQLVPTKQILTFEEIVAVCRAAAKLGIRKIKITGGEPLVRRGCPSLIGRIKEIKGVEQVTLTTNGILLGEYLDALLDNGLDAVNISLDTLDGDRYRKMTGCGELSFVLESLDRAVKSRLRVKINSVLQKGINDREWDDLAKLAQNRPVDVRFIEIMPIGCGKRYETVSGDEVLAALRGKYYAAERELSVHGNGPAVYYRIPGFAGSIGFISAVHGKFCDSCNRIRMTAEGELKPCLCYGESIDMREILRSSISEEVRDDKVCEAICEAVRQKPAMHCFESKEQISEDRQMVQIGG